MPSCTGHRYIDEQFTAQVQYGISYGNAPAVVYPPYISETSVYNKNLTFDLYRPLGDTLQKRPAIVMVYGGAFLIGTTLQPQLVDYCRYFAQRGYVVAAIDYRLGFNIANGETAIRAVYRAAQDVKSAIRHLKYHANTYGIDTNYVFAGGNSAGGIAAIHAAYVNEAERNASDIMNPTYGGGPFNNWSNLGCTECSGNAYGQAPASISGVPDLVISLWGAIADTSFMQAATDAPLISFHGTNDLIVNVDTGSPFDYPAFPDLYGAIPMAARANHVGISHQMHLFQGAGHEVWFNAADATIIQQESAVFFYEFLRPDAPNMLGNTTVCSNSIETYSVPFHDGATYCWQVTGGSIIGGDTGNSIVVQWLPTANEGSIAVREISRNVVESQPAIYPINIVSLAVPTNVSTVYTTSNRAEIAWTATEGLQFECDYRLLGTAAWTTVQTVSATGIILNNLTACQTYEIRVRTICGGAYYSGYTTVYQFTTECLRAKLRLMLEGFYNPALYTMNHSLRSNNLLPTSQPYSVAPWNYNGGENLAILPPNMTDWVLLEVRDATNPANLLDRSAAILLSDGSVVDIDGNPNGVRFKQLTQVGNYFVSVKHRNHVGAMTATPIVLPSGAIYDFTTAATQAYGIGQQTALPNSNQWGLYAADYNHDGIINYRDGNTYLQSSTFVPQYTTIDANGNGLKDAADFDLFRRNAQIVGIVEVR